MTVSTLGVFCRAWSQTALRLMGLVPRYTSLAVMSILHSESLIRLARAEEEKPAKTMECTAPIRAQASMAMASSGIMGM